MPVKTTPAVKLSVLKVIKEDQKVTLYLLNGDKLIFEVQSGPGPFPWVSGEVRLEDKRGHRVLAKVEL